MKPKHSEKSLYLIAIIDILMIGILIINLIWICFDWFFQLDMINNFFRKGLTSFYSFYKPVNEKFLYYDLIFVSIYILEIIIRWIYAIIRKSHHKWYLYPLIHWYDVLGSIPVGGWRILRFLRIFTIIFKLQKSQKIDITEYHIYKFLVKYFNILVEEISDKVTVRILDRFKNEINTGRPTINKIKNEVLIANKNELIELITIKLQLIIKNSYEIHEEEIKQYFDLKIQDIINENEEIKRISKIPGIGRIVSLSLQNAVKDIINQTIIGIFMDLSDNKNKNFISGLATSIFNNLISAEKNKRNIYFDLIMETIDIISDQVKEKEWKLNELPDIKLDKSIMN
jgi:hypothetical protein